MLLWLMSPGMCSRAEGGRTAASLVIVDEANRLKGIVSISDILGFLLL